MDNCSGNLTISGNIQKVVTVILTSTTFSCVWDNWQRLARELQIQSTDLASLQHQHKTGVIDHSTTFTQLFEFWLSQYPEEANVETLVGILRRLNLNLVAKELENSFRIGVTTGLEENHKCIQVNLEKALPKGNEVEMRGQLNFISSRGTVKNDNFVEGQEILLVTNRVSNQSLHNTEVTPMFSNQIEKFQDSDASTSATLLNSKSSDKQSNSYISCSVSSKEHQRICRRYRRTIVGLTCTFLVILVGVLFFSLGYDLGFRKNPKESIHANFSVIFIQSYSDYKQLLSNIDTLNNVNVTVSFQNLTNWVSNFVGYKPKGELNLEFTGFTDITVIVKIMQSFTEVSSVTITSTSEFRCDFEKVPYLKNAVVVEVHKLYLRNFAGCPLFFKVLSEYFVLKNLQVLSVRSSELTKTNIVHIQEICRNAEETLTIIDLSNSTLTSPFIDRNLDTLPYVKELYMDYRFHDFGTTTYINSDMDKILPKLEKLVTRQGCLDLHQFKYLSGLPYLRNVKTGIRVPEKTSEFNIHEALSDFSRNTFFELTICFAPIHLYRKIVDKDKIIKKGYNFTLHTYWSIK